MVLFRVDDFPFTKKEETWRHNLSNFKLFNEVMKKHNANYVLGVIPDRLDDAMVEYLAEEQYMIDVALHGIHHDERFMNEFHSGETEEQIYQAIMSAKYPLEAAFGRIDTYIPPHNTFDGPTVNALVRAGFRALFGGPGSESAALRYAEKKGLNVIEHLPPLYGRTDEMKDRGVIEAVKRSTAEGRNAYLALHWTWEWNVGLQNLDSFLSAIDDDISIGRDGRPLL